MVGCVATTITVLVIYTWLESAEGVKCFCDRSSCEESLICSADYCIIGLRRDGSDSSNSAKLRQLCGSGDANPSQIDKCDQRSDGWQEVCYCREEFCNTFAFLRQSMDAHTEGRHTMLSSSNNGDSGFLNSNNFFNTPEHIYPQPPQEGGGRAQRSSLIVLLVIIPLAVGGLAVCLIFLNYHCKMC